MTFYIFTFLSLSHHCEALNSLICADVPLRNYSLTHFISLYWQQLQLVKIIWQEGHIAAVHCIRQVAPVCSPPNTCFLGPIQVHIPSDMSIISAVFAQLMAVSCYTLQRFTWVMDECLWPMYAWSINRW